ncbi:MFS general substrate transporter [Ceratobasidium sp. AG-I]|nr:MFS general substrate transporter [Ceratobasidium sp. AG-I]
MHELDTNVETAPLLPPKPKLRWITVFVLVILVAIINGTSELIWPFINPMILELGIAPDKKSIGFYTGLMETIASFFGFATLIPGSIAADRWGRKAVLCSCLLGTAIGLSFFGVSSTLPALIFCRSVGYALGPQLHWSMTVTTLGDVADASNRGIAFSAVNASYRIGQFFSPIFAMLLARPSLHYKWFQSEFWVAYPYALPCWAGAFLCLVAVYITMYCLPETAPGLANTIDDVPAGNDYSVAASKKPAILQAVRGEPTPPEIDPTMLALPAVITIDKAPATLFSSHIIQLLISSWIMYFMAMSSFSLFPLWAYTPIADGGLGASEIVIGTYISARAIIHFLILGPFAYLETRLGVYRLYAYSLTMFTVIGSIAFPIINLLARIYGAHSLYTNIAIFLGFAAGGFGNYCTTCMVMMMNQAAPSPHALSRLVGISQTVLALGQCMAPIVTLSVFQFSIKSDILNGNLVWVFLIGLALAASSHSFTLKPPRVEN